MLIRGSWGQRLAVGASSNAGIYLLQPAIKAFKEKSACELNLTIDDNASIAARLDNFEIDVAVMGWWDQRPGTSATVWRREELVLIVAPQHPWAQRKHIAKDDLKALPMVGGESGTGTKRLLENYLGRDAQLAVSMQLGSTEAVKRAMQAGLGVSLVMAASVEQERRSGLLCAIPVEDRGLHKEIWIVERQRNMSPTLASDFVNFMLAEN